MNIRASILLLAGCCLLSAGCQREAAIPSDSFRLTVERIITERDIVVSVLKIRVAHNASISVDSDHAHSMVLLADFPSDATRDGQVALTASRVTRQGDDYAYVQTLIGAKAGGGSGSSPGFTGGPTVWSVPAATALGTYFAVSATAGDYKLDTPIEIARLDGKPVTLVVGKPTK